MVIADFLDQQGNDPDRFTRNLVSEVRTTLADYPDIRIERLMQPVADADDDGSEHAMQIGARPDINATIVIWGDYVGTERQPQAHIHFDIVKLVSSYVTSSLYEGYGPVQIAEQPSMFDFTINMGTQLGQVTAFVAGVVLFNANDHLAAEPLFTTAIAVVEQPLAQEFSRALHYYRGTNYWYLGRFLEAQPDLELLKPQSALTSDRVDDLDLSILNVLGIVYSDLGENQQALDFYNQALSLRRAVGDKAGEATTLNNIGLVYAVLGEKQQALDYYNQALPLQRAVGDKAGEATTLNNIGRVYDDLGEKQQALDYLKQALPLFRAVGDKAGEAATLNNIGLVYDALGEKQQALDYYNQALPLRRAVGDKAGEATTLYNIGLIYDALGEKQQALDYDNQALPLFRAVGDKAGEAKIFNNIGSIYDSLSEKQEALSYYSQALPLWRTVGNKAGEAIALNNIGIIYFDLGESSKALSFLNQALQVMDDRLGIGAITGNIGRVYAGLGESEKALNNFRDAIEILQQTDDNFYEVRVRRRLIEFLYADSKLDEALIELETAITLATVLNHPDLPDLQALLAEINAQRGK